MGISCIVINLDEQKERMDFQTQQLSNAGFQIFRLSANDPAHKDAYDELKLTWERPLTFAEVSCFLNHKKAWQIIARKNEPMLVLEDDAFIVNDLVETLNEIAEIDDIEYVNVERTAKPTKKTVGLTSSNTLTHAKLYRLFLGRSGAGGYYLSPKGANKLLQKASNKSAALSDKFINACYNLNAYQLEPAMLVQFDQCDALNIKAPLKTQSSCSIGRVRRRTQMGQQPLSQLVICKLRRFKGQSRIFLRRVTTLFCSKNRHINVSNKFYNF